MDLFFACFEHLFFMILYSIVLYILQVEACCIESETCL